MLASLSAFPTVDQDERPSGEAPLEPEPFLEVLFHAHPARWGTLTPPGWFVRGRPMPVGRGTPLVYAWGPDSPAPLADPCLSRDLLEITWDGSEFNLAVRSDRRPVTIRLPDGRVTTRSDALPPGSSVTVEDRLVLGLEHRVSPCRWHGWYRSRFPAEAALDPGPDRPLGLVGESEALWTLRRRILALPPGPADVFLHGETGAGKELVAQAVHRRVRGPRAPYGVVNCASIPGSLFESELFGYTAGAFSGAAREGRRGAFREADGGSLFLDELAELAVDAQAKLNRVIETRTVQSVGGRHTEAQPVDVLMIYATWQDLGALVSQGRFRADLMNRCRRLVLEVPPLRRRACDVPRLALFLLQSMLTRTRAEAAPGGATSLPAVLRLESLFVDPENRRPLVLPPVMLALMAHDWREGNVRALYNTLQQAAFAYLAGGAFEVELGGADAALAATEPPVVPAPPPRVPRAERVRPPEAITLEEWRAAYAELGSVRKVAARFGFSVSTVDKYLRLANAGAGAARQDG